VVTGALYHRTPWLERKSRWPAGLLCGKHAWVTTSAGLILAQESIPGLTVDTGSLADAFSVRSSIRARRCRGPQHGGEQAGLRAELWCSHHFPDVETAARSSRDVSTGATSFVHRIWANLRTGTVRPVFCRDPTASTH